MPRHRASLKAGNEAAVLWLLGRKKTTKKPSSSLIRNMKTIGRKRRLKRCTIRRKKAGKYSVVMIVVGLGNKIEHQSSSSSP